MFTMKKVLLAGFVFCALSFESISMASRQKAEDKPQEAQTITAEKKPENPAAQTPEGARAVVDLQSGLSAIANKALPSVVNIATTQVIEGRERGGDLPRFAPGSPFEDLFREFFDQMDQRPRKVQSLGSGFIIKMDGATAYIVTNNHVIAEAKKINILLHDKTEIEANLHAADERTDIAVLKADLTTVPENKRPKALDWGNSDVTRVGDFVIAIGNAFGLGSTLTFGVVSFKGRDLMTRRNEYVDDFIQHSAPINMGNSGGCLLNINGEVVGINTAIFTPSGGNVGIGFAIPSTVAKNTVDQLIQFKRTKRGYLGLRIQQMTDDMAESLGLKGRGAIVGSVTPEGPGDKAGIQSGDVVLEYDGTPLNDNNRITRLVGETPIGKKVKVKIWRKGKEQDMEVTIGEFEEAQEKGHVDAPATKGGKDAKSTATAEVLGMRLGPVTEEVRQRFNIKGDKGVLVERVDPNSIAAESGIMRGDIIMEVNQKVLASVKELTAAVEEAKSKKRKNVFLLVTRNNEPRFMSLRIDDEDEKKN